MKSSGLGLRLKRGVLMGLLAVVSLSTNVTAGMPR